MTNDYLGLAEFRIDKPRFASQSACVQVIVVTNTGAGGITVCEVQ